MLLPFSDLPKLSRELDALPEINTALRNLLDNRRDLTIDRKERWKVTLKRNALASRYSDLAREWRIAVLYARTEGPRIEQYRRAVKSGAFVVVVVDGREARSFASHGDKRKRGWYPLDDANALKLGPRLRTGDDPVARRLPMIMLEPITDSDGGQHDALETFKDREDSILGYLAHRIADAIAERDNLGADIMTACLKAGSLRILAPKPLERCSKARRADPPCDSLDAWIAPERASWAASVPARTVLAHVLPYFQAEGEKW